MSNNKYLNMGTGMANDFFEPYDKLVADSNFMDGFEFAIRAIYPNNKEKELFIKGGRIHQILTAGMMRYSETHTEEETDMFRLGGGVACLVSTSHETWSAKERKVISEYVAESFASYICRQNDLGVPLAEDPKNLAKEYKKSIRKDVTVTFS